MLSVKRPAVCSDPPAVAYARALELQEPVFLPAAYFCDDRGWSVMNQMQGVMSAEGQINYSVQHPGVIKAWHRHAPDRFLDVSAGTSRSACTTGQTSPGCRCSARSPGVLIIPPPLWHGAATIGAEPAGLLYYVTKAYNPKSPDEERRAHDSVPGFPWGTRHG